MLLQSADCYLVNCLKNITEYFQKDKKSIVYEEYKFDISNPNEIECANQNSCCVNIFCNEVMASLAKLVIKKTHGNIFFMMYH